LETHPDLYWKAAEFEKHDPVTGKRFTWVEGESLKEIAENPERIKQIKEDYKKKQQQNKAGREDGTLKNVLSSDDPEREGCLICHL
jgi:hypothetical protein